MRKRTRKFVTATVLTAVICAGGLGGLTYYGLQTGRFGHSKADSLAMINASEPGRQAATEAEEKAEEEQTAIEEKARKDAEAKAKAEVEAKSAKEALLATHPELKSEITFQLPTGDEKLDSQTLLTWLTDNGDGTYTKDEDRWNENINAYVQNMADRIETLGKERIFHATGLGEILVDGSRYYGWEVDREKEIAQLTAELNSGTVTSREPNYTSRESAKADDNYGIGQDYCEIDASRQHLWIYKGGQMAFETDVVTGMMDQSHYTPEGTYLIFHKEKNATLKGDLLPDGKRTYETPVSYWMPITDTGIGLHDAYWKSVFGYGQNVWNGSHGCINLPADVAGTVYELMTTDMPVVIYYSEGCELREAPPSEVDQYIAAQQAAAEQKKKEEEEKAKEEAERAAAEKAAQEQAAAEKAAQEQAAAEKAAQEQAAAEKAAQEQAAAEKAAQEQAAAEKAAQEQAAAEKAAQEQAAADPTSTITTSVTPA
ncbi:MAG: L,D-transpeptidase family protein [Bilifractor sp.]